jgi:uncharacterized protein YecE (DUF72 family)
VGCSGWSYRDWRGTVYPPEATARSWFGHYAEHFDTVELNATFYRLPTAETIRGWRTQAPPGFVYAVKVGQFGTHRKKLREPAGWLGRHLDRVRHLGPHLGPNLFQLPPRWRRDLGRLTALLEVLPSDLRWAVEVRDPDWVHDDVLTLLARHQVALCIHDLLADHPWERTASWTYLRFHGPRALEAPYQGRYGTARLARIAERLEGWLDQGTDVHAYFNNDVGGAAAFDAAWLRSRLAP